MCCSFLLLLYFLCFLWVFFGVGNTEIFHPPSSSPTGQIVKLVCSGEIHVQLPNHVRQSPNESQNCTWCAQTVLGRTKNVGKENGNSLFYPFVFHLFFHFFSFLKAHKQKYFHFLNAAVQCWNPLKWALVPEKNYCHITTPWSHTERKVTWWKKATHYILVTWPVPIPGGVPWWWPPTSRSSSRTWPWPWPGFFPLQFPFSFPLPLPFTFPLSFPLSVAFPLFLTPTFHLFIALTLSSIFLLVFLFIFSTLQNTINKIHLENATKLSFY